MSQVKLTTLMNSDGSKQASSSDVIDGATKTKAFSPFALTVLAGIDAAAQRATLVAAKSGSNSDITELTGLTKQLTALQGGVSKGYIDGFRMQYVSGSAITVTAGSAYVLGAGKVLTLAADKEFTALTGLVVSGTQHFYLYDNAGTPDIEISTVLPVKYYGTAYQKTGDATRRYLGSFLTNATGVIFQFRHDPTVGRVRFQAPGSGSAPFVQVNGTPAASPTFVAVTTLPSGANVLAPRGPTTTLHINVTTQAGGSFFVASGDYPYTPTTSDWDAYANNGSSYIGQQLDVPIGQTGANAGGYWFWGSLTVNAYCRSYTFER